MYINTTRDLASIAKQRRIALGWSQQALADRMGVTRQWVVALEHGKPRLELRLVLRALKALGLGVSVEVPPTGARDLTHPQWPRHTPLADLRPPAAAPTSPPAPTRRQPGGRVSAPVPLLLTIAEHQLHNPDVVVEGHRRAAALPWPVAPWTRSSQRRRQGGPASPQDEHAPPTKSPRGADGP